MATSVKKWINHNRSLVIGAVLCAALTAFAFGCEVTTESPFDQQEKVTRSELDIQVRNYVDRVELAYQDLATKEAIIKAIAEVGLAYAEGGSINMVGLASTIAGIIGVGAVIDNRRKDAVIKNKSNALAQLDAWWRSRSQSPASEPDKESQHA